MIPDPVRSSWTSDHSRHQCDLGTGAAQESPVVLRNLRRYPSNDLYTTAIAEAEIRFGLAILPRGKKHTELRNQLDLILKQEFAGRIL